MTLAAGPLSLDADPHAPRAGVRQPPQQRRQVHRWPGGHIGLHVAAEAGEAVVRVRDDGIGISPELLARAFDLFVQETAPSTGRRAGWASG